VHAPGELAICTLEKKWNRADLPPVFNFINKINVDREDWFERAGERPKVIRATTDNLSLVPKRQRLPLRD